MDARGQTATGCQEVYLAASHRALQRATLCPRVLTYIFFALFTNALLHISHVLKSCQKLEPEGKRGREGAIEEERGVIESLHKTHLSRVQQ